VRDTRYRCSTDFINYPIPPSTVMQETVAVFCEGKINHGVQS